MIPYIKQVVEVQKFEWYVKVMSYTNELTCLMKIRRYILILYEVHIRKNTSHSELHMFNFE